MSMQSNPASLKAVKESPYAWVILLSVYLASLAAPVNLFKVPTVMLKMCETFQMDLSDGGLFMSVFSIAGCILAIPSGLIIQRLGLKPVGLLASGSLLVGTLIGSLADPSGFTVFGYSIKGLYILFGGRLIEGIGMGLIMVMAPAAIALWFPANRRGMPMGLWATSVGIGSISMYTLAPRLATAYGLNSVWWAGTIVAFVAFVLFALLFRSPRPEEKLEAPVPQDSGGAEVTIKNVMTNHRLWMVSFQFMCFNLIVMAFSTYYPTFLKQVREFTEIQAGDMSSLIVVVSIFAGPLAGYVTDRTWKRRYWVLSSWAVALVLYLFPFSVTGLMIPGLLIAMGILTAPIVPPCFASIPEIVGSPKLVGLGMAMMALGQNVGMLIGPWAFGLSVESQGWMTSCYLLTPFFIIAFIAAWIAKIK